MKQPSTIEIAREGRTAILTLNRPNLLNSINSELMREVTAAMTEFASDDAVGCVVINGNGRAFSAGFDLKESAERKLDTVAEWRTLLEADFEFLVQFWDCPKPVIAAVHGYCLAGAFEMALACDITIAAEGTRFGEPEVRFGSGAVALLLPWMTTPKLAKELLLTGNDRIDARRALAMGIVNEVVPEGTHLERALTVARDITHAAPQSVLLTKRAINRTYEIMGMRQALLAALDMDVLIEAGAGPERSEFNRIRKENGLKAAVAWRDAKFASNGGQG
jgi:enoyl-CoA hydratase